MMILASVLLLGAVAQVNGNLARRLSARMERHLRSARRRLILGPGETLSLEAGTPGKKVDLERAMQRLFRGSRNFGGDDGYNKVVAEDTKVEHRINRRLDRLDKNVQVNIRYAVDENGKPLKCDDPKQFFNSPWKSIIVEDDRLIPFTGTIVYQPNEDGNLWHLVTFELPYVADPCNGWINDTDFKKLEPEFDLTDDVEECTEAYNTEMKKLREQAHSDYLESQSPNTETCHEIRDLKNKTKQYNEGDKVRVLINQKHGPAWVDGKIEEVTGKGNFRVSYRPNKARTGEKKTTIIRSSFKIIKRE